MTQANECQRTILEQLNALNRFFMVEFKVETIVLIDAVTVRLCCRTRNKINFDVHHDEGADLYNIKAYLLRNYGLDVTELINVEGIFCDQLGDLLRDAHEKANSKT
jgi:hypothetical protein